MFSYWPMVRSNACCRCGASRPCAQRKRSAKKFDKSELTARKCLAESVTLRVRSRLHHIATEEFLIPKCPTTCKCLISHDVFTGEKLPVARSCQPPRTACAAQNAQPRADSRGQANAGSAEKDRPPL